MWPPTLEESENAKNHFPVIAQLEDKVRDLEERLHSQIAQSAEKVRQLEEQFAHANQALDGARLFCHSMSSSLSWKLTWPLRVLRDALSTSLKRVKHGQ
jgi:hypothetical protein